MAQRRQPRPTTASRCWRSPNFTEDPEKENHTGLHHSAFEYGGFDDLNATYTYASREAGIEPSFCLDHGMTFSYYYTDPDGNRIELQVDNFGDWAESTEWMRTSAEFKASPIQFVDPGRVADDRAAGMAFDEIHAKAMAGGYAPDEAPVVVQAVLEALQVRGGRAVAPRRRRGDPGHRSRRRIPTYAREEVRLLAPVLPRKYLAIGLNYADHIAESGMEAPEFPIFFNKQALVWSGRATTCTHARVTCSTARRLAVVIEKRCRHVPEERAQEVIAGYTIANDVSVRDWRLRTPTMTMGKSFDAWPLGLGRDRRRAGRSPRALDQDLGQRRAAPGRQHERDGL